MHMREAGVFANRLGGNAKAIGPLRPERLMQKLILTNLPHHMLPRAHPIFDIRICAVHQKELDRVNVVVSGGKEECGLALLRRLRVHVHSVSASSHECATLITLQP